MLLHTSVISIASDRTLQHIIIKVDSSNFTYKISVLMTKVDIKLVQSSEYFWYSDNRFFSTFGGFDGKLLDGKFTVFYKKGNLMESGNFNLGLKVGVWNQWFENGQIMETSNWEKGKLQGKLERYYSDSRLKELRRYKNNELHGKQIEYDNTGKVLRVSKYKSGVLIGKPKEKAKKVREKKEAKPTSKEKTK